MKTYHFLTTRRFFTGQLLRRFAGNSFARTTFPQISGYTLVSPLKEQTDSDHNSIGIYSKRREEKVVIKHLSYSGNKMALYQLLNEASMLHMLNAAASRVPKSSPSITFPKLLETKQGSQEMYLVMELVEGKVLRDSTSQLKLETLIHCLEFMDALIKFVPTNVQKQLPVRMPWLQHLSILVYFAIIVKAKPQNCSLYSRMLFRYFVFAAQTIFTQTQYRLTHKDLHQDNILLQAKNITIIDPQVSVLAEKFSDLSIVARLYLGELSRKQMKYLLSYFLKTPADKAAFSRLSIYFSFQLMAIKGVDHTFYNGAIAYLEALDAKLLKDL